MAFPLGCFNQFLPNHATLLLMEHVPPFLYINHLDTFHCHDLPVLCETDIKSCLVSTFKHNFAEHFLETISQETLCCILHSVGVPSVKGLFLVSSRENMFWELFTPQIVRTFQTLEIENWKEKVIPNKPSSCGVFSVLYSYLIPGLSDLLEAQAFLDFEIGKLEISLLCKCAYGHMEVSIKEHPCVGCGCPCGGFPAQNIALFGIL